MAEIYRFDQDDIYPVFRELFHKQNATAKD